MFALIWICCAAALPGCNSKTPFLDNLDEDRANRVVALLLDAGIACSKSAGEEGMWNVSVSSKHFAEAVELAEDAGLPGKKYEGVGEVFKRTGMVSSPTEERIRFMHALSEDLSATLTEIDGVISARVHVVLPENAPFTKDIKPSSASVFIKYKHDADMESKIPYIKNLVKDSIEGLEYNNVSLILFRADAPRDSPVGQDAFKSVFGVLVSGDSVEMLIALLVLSAVVFGLLGAGGGWLGWLLYTRRKQGNTAG
jgi:type III secretion protein J